MVARIARSWLVPVALAALGCTTAAAPDDSSGPTDVRELLQGQGATESGGELDDRAVAGKWLWPGATIYAIVDPQSPEWWRPWGSVTAGDEANREFVQAAEELAANTPVRVHYVASEDEVEGDHYLEILPPAEEGSGVASIGHQTQLWGLVGDFKLQAGAGAVRHELGHVVGLRHTQVRSDRDEYIDIHIDAVAEDKRHNFEKDAAEGHDLGPYDFGSVMHYSSYAFSTDDCATITRKGAESDRCSVAPEERILSTDHYSLWNYVVISALYCLPQYCGDNCASAERCNEPGVLRNLARFTHYEETGSTELPVDLAECGDGFVDEGEECDSTLGCDEDCSFGVCGDDIIEGDEDCEFGGEETPVCNGDCTIAVCGDGKVNAAAGEQCDDGEESQHCNFDCTAAICGDGMINAARGEKCDDGGETPYCDRDCTLAVCGDGLINTAAGELCDDGSGQGCDEPCPVVDYPADSPEADRGGLGDDELPSHCGVAAPGQSSLLWLLAIGLALMRRKRSVLPN